MISIKSTSGSFYKPAYRLFQRKRHKVFDAAGWEKLIITGQHINFQPVEQFCRSIVGKVLLFTLAEVGGGYFGGLAGKQVIGKVSSVAGKWLFPIGIGTVGALAIYLIASKISRKTHHLFLALTSIFAAYIISQSLLQIVDIGAATGSQIGEQTGNYVGTVLGGFGGLYLAGSPIVFWDKQDPWSGYCVCMARYLAAQIVLDLLFGTHLDPKLAIIVSMLTFPIRTIVPTLAYNSNVIIPAINCLREDEIPKKSLSKITIQWISNKITGKNQPYSPKLNEKIHLTLGPAFQHMHGNSSKSFGPTRLYKMILTPFKAVLQVAEKAKTNMGEKKDVIIENAVREFVNGTLRTVHQYINLLNDSAEIQAAQANFKMSYGNPEEQREAQKVLIAALDEMVENVPGFTKTLFDTFSKMIDENIQTLVSTTIVKIQELEVQIVGISLLKIDENPYLPDMIRIYLKYYLIFAYLHQSKLSSAMTLSEEESTIIELATFLISSYTHQIAPSISDKVSFLAKKTFRSFVNVKKMAKYALVKSDKTVHFTGQDIQPGSNYFKAFFSKRIFTDYVAVERRQEESYVWVRSVEEQKKYEQRKEMRVVQLDEEPNVEDKYFEEKSL